MNALRRWRPPAEASERERPWPRGLVAGAGMAAGTVRVVAVRQDPVLYRFRAIEPTSEKCHPSKLSLR
jgi:hypothetical protein